MTALRAVDSPAFDLREIVVEELSRRTLADPHSVLGAVMDRISPRQYRRALEQALGDYLRTTAKSLPGAQRGSDTKTQSGAREAPSRFERVARHFRQLHCPERGGWKWLEQCTRDDLRDAAAYRRRIADRTLSAADSLERLAASMKRGQLVGDLPPGLVAEALRALDSEERA